MKHILRYIKHVLQCGIFYEAKGKLLVHGYTDVDWAGNVSNKDQLVVSCFLLEVVLLVGVVKNNQQLHHHAQRQNIKNTRTIACEVVWLQKLL